eukprot:TRINITY_DN7498_c0_g1_i6.p1 TRINITY_DN7498_c0_g1~~TRINITY_DN7498_c0_g1_i6.p1  ORF type:complete len:473 (-),score=32.20 TRINITY_DN7498_c0_g1_i6:97-1515(-)
MLKFESQITKHWYVYYDEAGFHLVGQLHLIPVLFDDGNSWRRCFLFTTNLHVPLPESQSKLVRDFYNLRYVPSMVTLVDETGKILCQNPASVAYYGILAEDSRVHSEQTKENPKKQYINLIKELLDNDESLYQEVTRTTDTGVSWKGKLNIPRSIQPDSRKDTWQHVEISRMRDPVSCIRSYIVIQTDVTQQVHQELQIQDMAEREKNLLQEMLPQHILEKLLDKADGIPLNTDHDLNQIHTASGRQVDLDLMQQVDVQELATEHKEVTILFCDVQTFENGDNKNSHYGETLSRLNRVFSAFDDLLQYFGVYKVETVGEKYMAAAGIINTVLHEDGTVQYQVNTIDPQHAKRAFDFACAMLLAVKKLSQEDGIPVNIRIGLHTGPVVSGVVGTKMPRFCLFGDTVNTASRMETTGAYSRIHVSHTTQSLLQDEQWESTGGVQVKGKGIMNTFFLKNDSVDQGENGHMMFFKS